MSMDHFLNFLQGAASAIGIAPTRRSYRIERRGFEKDAENLRSDFKTVANGLRQALKHEQTNYRTR